MAGLKFTFTGDNQDVLKKINQIQTELKKVYNRKNTKIDLSAGIDFSLLGENFKRLDQQSREAFDNMSKDAQKYVKEIQENILSLQQVEKMQAGLNSLYEDGDIDLNAYIQSQARLTVLHEELAKGINENRAALEAETTTTKIAADSIAGLHAKVLMLTTDYMNLSKAQREGTEGAALLKNLQETQTQLNNASLSMDKYASGAKTKFDSLGMSITQIARELPSLAMGPQMFFLAISNNLGPFQDALAAARKEYQEMTAAGKTATPVWKQLLSSLKGSGPILAVVTTLFVAFGDDIIEWVGKLISGKKEMKNFLSVSQELAVGIKQGTKEAISAVNKLDVLYKATQDQTRSLKERNAAVDEIQKMYPSYFNNLTNEAILAGKAKSIYAQLRDELIANSIARAQLSRMDDVANKREDALTKRRVQYNTYLKAQQELDKASIALENAKQKARERGITEGSAQEKLFLSKRQSDLEKAEENAQKELAIWRELVDEVKNYDKILGGISKSIDVSALTKDFDNDTDKNYNSIIDQQNKIAELLDKQAIERRRKEEDLENQAFQARINAMEEGEAKIRAQRALDNKKEIQDLKRQREDYIRTEIEYQKKVFDEQEELKAKKTKGYKKKTFDPTSVSVDTSALDSINQDTLKGQANDVAKYYKEVLSKYQDYTAQRIAIEKQFLNDEKKLKEGMSKAQNDSEKEQYANALKELNKQKKRAITSISKSEIEDSGIWKMLMGDINALSTDTLEKLLSDAEQLVKTTNLSATDMKAMMDTINNARQNLIARNPFKTLKEEYEKYQKAIKKGDKQGASTSWSNVEQASESIKSNISTLGASLSSLGTTFSDELGEGIQKAVDVINDGITAFEVFGKTGEKSAGDTVKGISGIIGIITTLVGTVMNAFDSTKAEQERNIEYQRRQEGYWDSINYQVERYLELLKEAAGNDYFATATQSLTTLEKAREKAYKDIVKSMPVGDVDPTTFGLAQLFKSGKFAGKMTEYAFGGPQAKEIFDFIQANGGYDLQNKLISEEAIWAMKSNADIWSKLPEWMQQAIDKFVEFNDQTKELEETLNEDLFQTTSQSIEEAILEGLKSGKRGIADFGEDFEEIMRNALLQSFVIDQLRGKAQEFYKKYTLLADSDENGKLDLTAEEISDLREDWNDIIRAATEEAKYIDSIIGSSSSSSQEASSKGFATMSQDSADELNGRFTALQISGEESKNQLILLNQITNALLNVNEVGNATLNDMLYQQVLTNGYLEDIARYTKALQEIRADIAVVKTNTAALTRR
jgi:hypothetical protein|nr:MAG TPA: tail tape measure protein [Caudoviricetes sp.]